MKKPELRIAIATVLVLIIGLAWLSLDAVSTIRSTHKPASRRAGEPQQSVNSVPSAAASTAPPAQPATTPQPGFRVRDADPNANGLRGVPTKLGSLASRDYRERARFPKHTEPLTGNVDPIRRDREITRKRMPGPDGEAPSLIIHPSSVTYETPDTAMIYAYFVDAQDQMIAAEELSAVFNHEQLGYLVTTAMSDDGENGDEIAGDLIYTATFLPPAADVERYKGNYLVSVRGRSIDLQERATSTGFLYSVPDSHPTGRFRDRIVEGSLEIDVEVEVARPGRFHVEAALFDAAASEALAWAQTADVLAPGLHWMTISFYGLALYERGIDGPYTLSSVALSTTGRMPNQKNRVLESPYTTAAYKAADFTDEPFNEPDLIETADRLDRDGGPAAPAIDATP